MEKTETTTIEHDQWGRVEGVEKAWSPRDLSHWAKEENGRKTIFNESKGWREVKPKRWEPVPVDLSIEAGRHVLRCDKSCFILPQGYRWKTVEIERKVGD